MMNINLAIMEGTKVLQSNSIESAHLDSEILMTKVINKDRKYILLNSNNIIPKKSLDLFRKLIKKRSNRTPIAQLTNKKFFWDSEFFVNEDTLIPRPDTEIIVENVLKFTKYKNKLNILDIGVGSGCILISILKEKKCALFLL